MTVTTEARNASLQDLATLLQEQQARKVDFVAPAGAITAEGGDLVVKGTAQQIGDDGVTRTEGRYRPTEVCDQQVAAKLGIPSGYLNRLRREGRTDLWDSNVSGLLQGPEGGSADPRSFLVRTFQDYEGKGTGIARSLLSDSFGAIDHLDVLTACLEGIKDVQGSVQVTTCDLSETRMRVRVLAPEIKMLAPTLLKNYVSPFSGNRGADNPTVFAGFVLGNSETGSGAFSIAPQLTFEICNNGATITKDAMRRIHVGAKLDEGLIKWSEATQRNELALMKSKTADAVRTFLDVKYMERIIAEIEEKAGKKITNAAESVETVTKKLLFPESVRKQVFDFFIQSADLTAGGVMQAVTATAQTIENPDLATTVEESGLRALDLAAAL
jgi:hypothetical protein